MTLDRIVPESLRARIQRRKSGQALRAVFDRTRAIAPSDILLVSCLRNEMHRMRFFCDYYRALGVDRFLFIDNGSTDGFPDWAQGQDDVSVWYTQESYKDANFGIDWCNHLLSRYGIGHLCVTVDPDEFLVYPFCATRSLAELGQHLRDSRKDSLSALMLDMYGRGRMDESHLADGDDPFELCPYFDRDGYIQHRSYLQGVFVRGGPRMRVHNHDNPAHSPALNKLPVVWWQEHFRYESSMHNLAPHRLNRPNSKAAISTSGCLFHFKFVASLAQKIEEERSRKQHYGDGREYAKYGLSFDRPLYNAGVSVRYEGPGQLVDLGLMTRGDWF